MSPAFRRFLVFGVPLLLIVASIPLLFSRDTPEHLQDRLPHVVFLLGYIAGAIAVGWAARRYVHRSPVVWAVLSLVFTPLAGLVFLVAAGPPLAAAGNVGETFDRAVKERTKRRVVEADRTCPSCGNTLNIATREGLEAPQDEPWRLICSNCNEEIDGRALS